MHRRTAARELSEKHPCRSTRQRNRNRRVVSEVARSVARVVRQCHPQLHTVQSSAWSRLDRHFGMTDTATRGHQIQLAGPDQRVHTSAVAVLHLPAEQPTHRL